MIVDLRRLGGKGGVRWGEKRDTEGVGKISRLVMERVIEVLGLGCEVGERWVVVKLWNGESLIRW